MDPGCVAGRMIQTLSRLAQNHSHECRVRTPWDGVEAVLHRRPALIISQCLAKDKRGIQNPTTRVTKHTARTAPAGRDIREPKAENRARKRALEKAEKLRREGREEDRRTRRESIYALRAPLRNSKPLDTCPVPSRVCPGSESIASHLSPLTFLGPQARGPGSIGGHSGLLDSRLHTAGMTTDLEQGSSASGRVR